MRVRCLRDKLYKGDTPYEESWGDVISFPVKVGETYLVYGMCISNSIISYLILGKDYTYYPVFVPATCFESSYEGSLVGIHPCVSNTVSAGDFVAASKDFALDKDYYFKLVDGEREAILSWQNYKEYVESLDLVLRQD